MLLQIIVANGGEYELFSKTRILTDMQCIENFKDLLDLFQLRPQFKRNAIRFEINCKKN